MNNYEQLRANAKSHRAGGLHWIADDLEKAADRIATLEADKTALREALHVAEVTLRLDGERMRKRDMMTAQNEAALATAQAALANRGEAV